MFVVNENFGRDVRYVLRTLARAPAFVLGVTATFALAIGTNAAMLGLVTRLMIAAPAGVRDANQVARIQIERRSDDQAPYVMSTTSYTVFEALSNAHVFTSIAGEARAVGVVGRGSEVEEVNVMHVTGDYFRTLKVDAAFGRVIGAADDELPIGNNVVMLSFTYWKRHFANNRAVVGRELILGGQPYTVVGVTPRGFSGTDGNAVDLFIPFTTAQRSRPFGWWMVGGFNIMTLVVRVDSSRTFALAAQRATSVVAQSTNESLANQSRVVLDPLVPGASARETPQAKIALWLAGISLVVMLIAIANVGTLMLLRAARRKRDTAVRIALGASHAQLSRQLILESIVLALLGTLIGLLLSRWLGQLLRVVLLPQLAAGESFVDTRVLITTTALSLVAGLLAGLVPIAQVSRSSLTDDLRIGSSSSRLSLQNVLVTTQVALCTVLLVGAGLFVRSLERVQSQDLGFKTSGLLYATLDFQENVSTESKTQTYVAAIERLRNTSGVIRASAVQAMPFGNFHVPPISIPGSPDLMAAGQQPPFLYAATPEFLSMMQINLKSGRQINTGDTRLSPQVLVVNEALANFSWPGQSPIGKCVRIGYGASFNNMEDGNPAETAPCRTVIGVVRNIRARLLRAEGAEERLMQYYVPFEQVPEPPIPNQMSMNGLLIQVNGDADKFSTAVQHALQTNSAVQVFARVRPYEDLMEPQLRAWRLGATLFSAFGLLALGIAAVGLFGVISNLTAQRTRELGIRRALGAPKFNIWRLVVLRALQMVVLGIAVGVAASMLASPLVRDLLYRTSPWEPANMFVAVVVLVCVTVMAALWPAWRAARVDPLVALAADG